jgi:hypothetical protein
MSSGHNRQSVPEEMAYFKELFRILPESRELNSGPYDYEAAVLTSHQLPLQS